LQRLKTKWMPSEVTNTKSMSVHTTTAPMKLWLSRSVGVSKRSRPHLAQRDLPILGLRLGMQGDTFAPGHRVGLIELHSEAHHVVGQRARSIIAVACQGIRSIGEHRPDPGSVENGGVAHEHGSEAHGINMAHSGMGKTQGMTDFVNDG